VTLSLIDEWIPVSRARETADILRDSGAILTLQIYKDRPHEISADEVALTRRIVDHATR
jgi:phospholipase/carboxylesterase